MNFRTFLNWLKKKSSDQQEHKSKENSIKVGIPKFLNIWSTAPFWVAFFENLGMKVVFSSDTSEEQFRKYGKGRITMDSCFPVKALAGHIGELLSKDINILCVPMIYSLPSFLKGYVMDTLSCPRVMMAPENIKAGFLKEKNEFEERGIKYVSPFVPFGEPELVPKYLFEALKDVVDGLTYKKVVRAVLKGFEALQEFDKSMRTKSLEIIKWCAKNNKPAILVLARPYHMDPGIGHEIDVEFQRYGYPILWFNYLPKDKWLLEWLGISLDISDVWISSYSSNTNEIIWAAKFASKLPWITGVIRLSSYECGMDQPTFTPVQKIVESSGTLYFKFGELDETKPVGSIKIRIETIIYYLKKYSEKIIQQKLRRLGTIPSVLTSNL